MNYKYKRGGWGAYLIVSFLPVNVDIAALGGCSGTCDPYRSKGGTINHGGGGGCRAKSGKKGSGADSEKKKEVPQPQKKVKLLGRKKQASH